MYIYILNTRQRQRIYEIDGDGCDDGDDDCDDGDNTGDNDDDDHDDDGDNDDDMYQVLSLRSVDLFI